MFLILFVLLSITVTIQTLIVTIKNNTNTINSKENKKFIKIDRIGEASPFLRGET